MRLRKDIKTILKIAIMLLALSPVHAQESTGSAGQFLRLGVGARALAMGGAFSGLANDPSAIYWNPAGMSQIDQFQFELMNVTLPFEQTLNFFSGVLPLQKNFRLGLSWIGLRVGDIEGRTSNSEEPEFVFGNSQNAFFLSLGSSIGRALAVGGNIKVIRNQLDNITATGIGLDLALLLRPSDRLAFGVTLQDLGTDFRWNGGFIEPVDATLRFGTAIKIHDTFVLTGDLNKTSDLQTQFRVGAEFRLAELLPLWIGWNDNQVTGGAGFHLPFHHNFLQFNYGYSNDQMFDDVIHRISLVFGFGKKTEPRYSRSEHSASVKEIPRKTSADEKMSFAIVTATVLNVRSGPGTGFVIIAKINQGEKYPAFEDRGDWRKIELRRGQIGWVHKDYVDLVTE